VSAQPDVNPERCPVCGQPNECAMEIERRTGHAQPPCWCTQVDFSAALLASVPDEKKNLACICPACARRG
jgi:hypothetical protein